MTGWQPIETHDKSRTPILIAHIVDGVVYRAECAVYDGIIGYYSRSGGYACHWRTHWMPLPGLAAPPEPHRVSEGGQPEDAEYWRRRNALKPASPQSAPELDTSGMDDFQRGYSLGQRDAHEALNERIEALQRQLVALRNTRPTGCCCPRSPDDPADGMD